MIKEAGILHKGRAERIEMALRRAVSGSVFNLMTKDYIDNPRLLTDNHNMNIYYKEFHKVMSAKDAFVAARIKLIEEILEETK